MKKIERKQVSNFFFGCQDATEFNLHVTDIFLRGTWLNCCRLYLIHQYSVTF